MAYTVHNFEQGDVLYAEQLNEMDTQIAANEESIANSVSSDMLAENYSANKTYSIGDYVIYDNELYTCIYEITAPEGWNSAHWRIENLGDGISDLNRQISESREKYGLYAYDFNWKNRIYYFGQGFFADTNTRIGLQSIILAKEKIAISVNAGYMMSVGLFSSDVASVENELSVTAWITSTFIVEPGSYFLINVRKSDDSLIVPSDASNVTFSYPETKKYEQVMQEATFAVNLFGNEYDEVNRIEYKNTYVSIENYLPFVQTGTGEQSPENIREITVYSQSEIDIDGNQYVISLPDDISIAEALINLETGRVIIPRFTKVFTGNEDFTVTGSSKQNFVFILNSEYIGKPGLEGYGTCSHFKWSNYVYNYSGNTVQVSFGTDGYEERIVFLTPTGQYTKATLKSWLAEQYNNGTPVKVSFELKTPLYYVVSIPFNLSDWEVIATNTGIIRATKKLPVDESVENALKYDGIDQYLKELFQVHMTHNGNGKYVGDSRRNAIVTPQHYEFPVTISVDSGFWFAVQRYDGYEIGPTHLINNSPWIKPTDDPLIINSGDYWCMIVRRADDATTDETTQNNLHFDAVANFNDVYSKLMPLVNESAETINNYCVDMLFRKTPVSVELLGAVKYLQSWCMYNGYYYSTDGTHICKQNQDFTDVTTVDINVGHGNSFQIGNSNLAYISGWDDQKIYVVNLDTLTLDSVITLPTTGYTTCAVDEVRKLVYIFQRDDYPSTEVYYNFIVYNYDTDQVISTRKTSVKFAAMQACDMVDDRIVVLNGFGSTTAPDYYRVFDLNGNVIGEYFFPDYSAYEPEGVFIDRTTKELMIGLNGRNIYKISFEV